ncbi:MAG: hemerythrin domain-containing protein [Actinomycetota bacterium]|nr:hemerythrin domain-containing protein [Actinomycetota bacterium]
MADTEFTETTDALQLLTEDHRRVEQIFVELESGTFNPEARDELVSQMVEELSVHAAVEEQVLYPAMRKALPDGDEQVDHAIEEHQEVKDKLAELEEMDETHATTPVLRELIESVRHHVEEEEGELFAQLRQAIDHDELAKMGQAITAAKKVAPTHPHPNAPNTPPGNIVAGAVAGVADRIKDAVRKN